MEPSLLDLNFNEDSFDTFDYSSDVLLSDGLMHPPSPFDDDEPIALLEPKADPEAMMPDFLEESTGLSLNQECILGEMEPTLEGVDTDMDDLFGPSFNSDNLDMDFFQTQKSEPLPTHCAPMVKSETKTKRPYHRREVKALSPTRDIKRQRTTSLIQEKEDEAAFEPVLRKSKSMDRLDLSPKKDSEKYQRRLVANKKSAQASRERKKAMRSELEEKVALLSQENSTLAVEMTKLESENNLLKREFDQIQKAISQTDIFEQMKNPIRHDDSMPTSTATSVYLMMVLYSFSQYVKSDQAVASLQNCLPPSPVLV